MTATPSRIERAARGGIVVVAVLAAMALGWIAIDSWWSHPVDAGPRGGAIRDDAPDHEPGPDEWQLVHETFDDLDAWEPLELPKVDTESRYAIEREDGEAYLRAESRASASGLVWKRRFNTHVYPNLRWRWRVNNVYEKGDASKKSGDDFPLRIYVMFEYDPSKLSLVERIRYQSAKLATGEFPPHAVVHYMWANRPHDDAVIPNAYTSRCRMIPLQAGAERVGTWIEQDVDILADYRRAFGGEPPKMATIAIMNDSDDTGEASVSFLDDLEIYRPRPAGDRERR